MFELVGVILLWTFVAFVVVMVGGSALVMAAVFLAILWALAAGIFQGSGRVRRKDDP